MILSLVSYILLKYMRGGGVKKLPKQLPEIQIVIPCFLSTLGEWIAHLIIQNDQT